MMPLRSGFEIVLDTSEYTFDNPSVQMQWESWKASAKQTENDDIAKSIVQGLIQIAKQP